MYYSTERPFLTVDGLESGEMAGHSDYVGTLVEYPYTKSSVHGFDEYHLSNIFLEQLKVK